MQLTKSQKNIVEKLYKKYLSVIESKRDQNNSNDWTVNFKAPTGSGKTFISSSLCSKIFEHNFLIDKAKIIIVIGTISNAELPKQFAKKLNNYKKYHRFSNYDIEFISSPSNSKSSKIEDVKGFNLNNNKIFVFGISSFGKNTLFYQNGILNEFITNIKKDKYQLIFIRDEAHRGALKNAGLNKNDLEKFDAILTHNSDYVINMTATVKSNNNLIELKESDLQSDGEYLLKNNLIIPKFYEDEIDDDAIVIDKAINNFIEIKKEYLNLEGVNIRPAILIQVDNDYKNDFIKHNQFIETMDLLETKLKTAGLRYLKYIDIPYISENVGPATLEYASKIDSLIDVIIFKIGPATGWDIPRANMLLQLRNISSETLSIQTLGRIKRNPYPNLVKNDICDKYYLYSSYQVPSRERTCYELKPEFNETYLYVGKINKKSLKHKLFRNKYNNEVIKWLKSEDFNQKITEFKNDEIVYSNEKFCDTQKINKIPNYVALLIYNAQKKKEYNDDKNSLLISAFDETLIEIATKLKKDIEIVKYIFFNNINYVKDCFSNSLKSLKDKTESYEISYNGKLKNRYQLWIDNKIDPKKFNTKNIKNYGYVQITNDNKEKYIQYLDSTPELKFYNLFKEHILDNNENNIKINFFAKMPTLGSEIYFEYFSDTNQNICKSFMDFALVTNKKTYMFEVKSDDEDYNPDKTKELAFAYKKYMQKILYDNEYKLELIIYKYNKEKQSHSFHFWDKNNNKWNESNEIKLVFDNIFNKDLS